MGRSQAGFDGRSGQGYCGRILKITQCEELKPMSDMDDAAPPNPIINEGDDSPAPSPPIRIAATKSVQFAGLVKADSVGVKNGAVGAVVADEAGIELGFSFVNVARSLSVEKAGSQWMVASEARLDQSGAGIMVVNDARLDQSGAGIMVAGRVAATDARVAILLAGKVDGNVQALLDPQSAVRFGAAFGAALGVALILKRLLMGR
jgi:hypothetical protein